MRVYTQNQIRIYNYMFILKPIYKIVDTIKSRKRTYYDFIVNFPSWYKEKTLRIINYFMDLKYKVTHIKETNFQLGVEHLYRNNLNDAILRLVMVDRFFAPGDHQANYWLGWTYFLKNNYKKAAYHLQKANEADITHLGEFIRDYEQLLEVPSAIERQYRDLIAQYYGNKFLNNNKVHVPYSFVNSTMKQITDLPDSYSILELGSNVGLVGYEVRKRFPDEFTYTGVENSERMNKTVTQNYSNTIIYNQLLDTSIPSFLQSNSSKYDIVLSFCGLTFTKNLYSYFKHIYSIVEKSGYFAFCLPINQVSGLSLIQKEFIFNVGDIENAIKQTKFTILNATELYVEKNSKYYMVVCKKVVQDLE